MFEDLLQDPKTLPELNTKIKKIKRAHLEEAFVTKLKTVQEDKLSILHYYGLGGIGKTTLKNALYNSISTKPYIFSLQVDMQRDKNPLSVNDFYLSIEKQLSKKVPLYYFSLAYMIYFKKINPKVMMQNAKLSLAEEGSLVAELLDSSNFNRGFALTQVLYKYSDKKFFKNKTYIQEIEELENKSISEIEDTLSKFLFYDVREYIKTTVKNDFSLVAFFDTYEVILPNTRLYSVVKNFIKNSYESHTMFVTTGRDSFVVNESNKSYFTQINVASFTEEDSKEILELNGMKELDIIDAVVKNSAGVAIYLIASIKIYRKILQRGETPQVSSFSDVQEKIIQRLLCYATKSEIESYRALAIANRFDFEVFDFIKREFSIQEGFKDLIKNDFIEKKSERFYSFHKLLHQSILATTDKEEKEFIHKKLYKYFINLLEDENNLSAFSSIELLENVCYHGLHINKEDEFFSWLSTYEKKLKSYNVKRDLIPIFTEIVLPLLKKDQHIIKVKFILFELHLELHDKNSAKEMSESIINYHFLNKENDLQFKYYEALRIYGNKFTQEKALNFLEYVAKYAQDIHMQVEALWKLLTLNKNKELQGIYFGEVMLRIAKVTDEVKLIDYCRKMAKYYMNIQEQELAAASLEKAMLLAQKHLDPMHPDRADLYYTYSRYYAMQEYNFKDKAYNFLLKALKIYEVVYLSNNVDIAKCYNELAKQFYFEGYKEDILQRDLDLYKLYYAIIMSKVQKNDAKDEIDIYISLVLEVNVYNENKIYKDIVKYAYKNKKYELAKMYIQKADENFLAEIAFYKEENNLESLVSKYREVSAFYYTVENDALQYSYLQRRVALITEMSHELVMQLYSDLSKYHKAIFDSNKKLIRAKNSFDAKQKMDLEKSMHESLEKELFYLLKLSEVCLENLQIEKLDAIYFKIAKCYGFMGKKSLEEEYYLKKIALYLDKENSFLAQDTNYSIMIKYYETQKMYKEADIYYRRQLELREEQPYLEKIARGYAFYGKFLERYMENTQAAHEYFLREIELYKKDLLLNSTKIVTAYRTLGDFYLRNREFSNDMGVQQYKAALDLAYSESDNELIFFMLKYMMRSRIVGKTNIADELHRAAKYLLQRDEFLLFLDKLYPLYKEYYERHNQQKQLLELRENMEHIYKQEGICESFYRKKIKEVLIAKIRFKKPQKAGAQKEIEESLENAQDIFELCDATEELLKIYKESVQFYKQMKQKSKAIELLERWISKLSLSSLNFDLIMNNYVLIANEYWSIDTQKYFYYYEKNIEIALEQEQPVEAKYTQLLKKARSINDDLLVERYESLL